MDNSLQEFWALVTATWERGLAGVSIGELVSALVVIGIGIAVRHLFGRLVVRRLKKLAERSRTELDDAIIEALEGPLSFIPVVLAIFIAIQILPLNGGAALIGANINRSLIAFTIFWALYAITTPLAEALLGVGDLLTRELVDWLSKAAKVAFVFLGGAVVLEIWGIRVGPLLAGLGLFGVAVALGAQDLFKNLIAGLFIIAEHRFRIGDWILVDGVVEGTVEKIGFRTTTVRRFDKAEVYVPNGKLSDNAVTNFSRMTHRRIYWHIGLVYGTTIEQLREIRDRIETYVMENDEFAKPPAVPTFVHIDRFSDSSIDVMLYCFTNTTVWGEWLEIKERLALEIKRIVTEAGSSFAFPSRSLYVEQVPAAERPEIFPGQIDDLEEKTAAE